MRGSPTGVRRILVVADDTDLVRAVGRRLAREGYAVTHERDGRTAFTRAEGVAPDLILLDAASPGSAGLDTCRRLREGDPHTPVILMTARDRLVDTIAGFRLGADDCVAIPCEPIELVVRIEARLRRGAAGRGPCPVADEVYTFGSIRLDGRRAEVWRDRQPVELSAREFRLLQYFVAHRGATLSRDELLTQVWGYDAPPASRTVDVHVAWLRRKIEPSPRRPRFLLTVHGLGYKFVG